MFLAFVVYVFSILSHLNILLNGEFTQNWMTSILFFIIPILCFGSYFKYRVENQSTRLGIETVVKNSYLVLKILFFVFVLSIIIPSKQTLYAMGGAYIVETVIDSNQSKELLNRFDQMLKKDDTK